MRLMRRNLQPVWYCLFGSETPVIDDDGWETGEKDIGYGEPVKLLCNVSPATGQSQVEMFGNLDSYDKVIITDEVDCPIDENTVLFVDKEPVFDKTGKPLYDYTVRRVAKSLNSISVAVRKVKVT